MIIRQGGFSEIHHSELHSNILPHGKWCLASLPDTSSVMEQVIFLLSWRDTGNISQIMHEKQGFHVICWLCNQTYLLRVLQLENLTAKPSETVLKIMTVLQTSCSYFGTFWSVDAVFLVPYATKTQSVPVQLRGLHQTNHLYLVLFFSASDFVCLTCRKPMERKATQETDWRGLNTLLMRGEILETSLLWNQERNA